MKKNKTSDEDHERLLKILQEYVIGTPWENRNPESLSREELSQLMGEVIDYGIRKCYIFEIEKTDHGCIFEIVEKK